MKKLTKHIDVTERITCYEKGKTWKCDCGQKIGTKHEKESTKCATCGNINVDRDWMEREAPDKKQIQTNLGEW